MQFLSEKCIAVEFSAVQCSGARQKMCVIDAGYSNSDSSCEEEALGWCSSALGEEVSGIL